jgi:adenylosuccinate lyase
MALGKAGADRQAMHERLREHAMQAWEAVRQGLPNPLPERICQDEVFQAYLPEAQLLSLLDARQYVGDAPQRARALAEKISL